jgi:glycosyltransferase involved in cell wall biosynthesis
LRFLGLAYACEPAEGSEPGTGWAWSRMLARHADTWIITRTNNRSAIEEGLGSIPEADRLHFVYVDLPAWARFWKRGERGLRPYYMLWLVAARRRGRRLHREQPFDLVWHFTLANLWLGTSGGTIGPPFVWGPIGGAVTAPFHLVMSMSSRGKAYEAVRYIARAAGRYLNPMARSGWRTSSVILAMNDETLGWLPSRYRHKGRVLCHVALDVPAGTSDGLRRRGKTAMFAGRQLAWKGVDLALRAIALLPDWTMIVCGSGPESEHLHSLTGELGIGDRVDFRGRVPREEVLRMMRDEASVFVFPSLHDEGGWVVGEALTSGLPVVCLDRGGPPVLTSGVGAVIPSHGSPADVAQRLADGIEEAYQTVPATAIKRGTQLSMDHIADVLGHVIKEARQGALGP